MSFTLRSQLKILKNTGNRTTRKQDGPACSPAVVHGPGKSPVDRRKASPDKDFGQFLGAATDPESPSSRISKSNAREENLACSASFALVICPPMLNLCRFINRPDDSFRFVRRYAIGKKLVGVVTRQYDRISV